MSWQYILNIYLGIYRGDQPDTFHYYIYLHFSPLRISSVLTLGLSRVSRDDMSSCILIRRAGADTIHSAVVPMWIFYQFMISVVLLRILIVMLTITYKKIYDNMDTQWKSVKAVTMSQC